MSGPGAGRAQHPGGQAHPEADDQVAHVLRDADGDNGDDGGVLEQQVPADSPAHSLPKDGVAVRVCGPGPGDEAAELGISQRRAGACDARDDERQGDGWAGIVLGDRAGQGEDAGADDRAKANGGELEQADAAFETRLLVAVIDRFATQYSGHSQGLAQAVVQRHGLPFDRPAPIAPTGLKAASARNLCQFRTNWRDSPEYGVVEPRRRAKGGH